MTPEDPLDRLHRELGFKRLDPLWAKAEIVFGLLAFAVGLIGAIKFAARPAGEVAEWMWLGPILLVALGGYLALAGHRSHLYQSNNRLAAHLAELVRTQQQPAQQPEITPPEHPRR